MVRFGKGWTFDLLSESVEWCEHHSYKFNYESGTTHAHPLAISYIEGQQIVSLVDDIDDDAVCHN